MDESSFLLPYLLHCVLPELSPDQLFWETLQEAKQVEVVDKPQMDTTKVKKGKG